jgi:CSLREA domain-containing protein
MSASRVVVAAFVALIAALVTAATAAAKTYEVNKRSDHAPNACKKKDCTLREAVLAANARDGSDRILLPQRKTYNLAIANTLPVGEDEAAEGDLDIGDPLRVSHPGKGRAKVDANGIDRVFDLLDGGSTTFKRIVIRGGNDPDAGDGGGGGIQVDQADLVLRRSSVSQNHADGSYGGGIELNGDENADFTMVRSALSGNSSVSDSGALEAGNGPIVIERSKVIGNTSGGTAGGLYLDMNETSRIVNSTISGNRGNSAGGLGAYGPLTIENSTIANNRALTGGAGGVDIDDSDSTFVLRNSTFAGNSAENNGGGLVIGGVIQVQANALTIVRNSSEDGGGVFNDTSDPVEFENTLIGLNQADGVGEDCANGGAAGYEFDSLGHNLLSELDTDSCEGFDATGDFVNSNPKLGKLKNNGGPTQTVALKKGSPAINKADKQSAPNKDQRGVKRGKKPDIGAYERVKKKKKRGRR